MIIRQRSAYGDFWSDFQKFLFGGSTAAPPPPPPPPPPSVWPYVAGGLVAVVGLGVILMSD